MASDLAACQAAKELLQTLADKETGMKAANEEIRDIAQRLAHDVDRLQKECDAKAKVDQERHALSALRTQSVTAERELRLMKEDISMSAEALRESKEKESEQFKVLKEARNQENQLLEKISLLKGRVAEAERAELCYQRAVRRLSALRSLDPDEGGACTGSA